MHSARPKQSLIPREWRRRVVLPARLRAGASWSDACILNVSSRGLLIHTGRDAPKGSMIELRRGHYVIMARVVWRDGAKVGLHAEDRVPVEQIVGLGDTAALQPAAAESVMAETRKRRHSYESSRLRGRMLEFASIAVVAVSLAGVVFSMVERALEAPLSLVKAALGG